MEVISAFDKYVHYYVARFFRETMRNRLPYNPICVVTADEEPLGKAIDLSPLRKQQGSNGIITGNANA